MGGILYTILIGAVIGVLARFFKPGADPMGWILTIILGIVGAWAGGYIAGALGISSGVMGFVVSIVCAIVLLYLYEHCDRPVSREELLNKVWGYARHMDIETRTVDIHIAKLRRKIEADASEPRHLLTIRGGGYRLMSGG